VLVRVVRGKNKVLVVTDYYGIQVAAILALSAMCRRGRTRKSLAVPDGLSWFTRCW